MKAGRNQLGQVFAWACLFGFVALVNANPSYLKNTPQRIPPQAQQAEEPFLQALSFSISAPDLPWVEEQEFALEFSLWLTPEATALEDWLSIYILLPEGYSSPAHISGEWAAFYFRGTTRSLGFQLPLRVKAQKPALAGFPLLLTLGQRRTHAVGFIGSGEKGHAAAIALCDKEGKPRWPEPYSEDISWSRQRESWWSFHTSVSEGLAFVGEVLGLDIRAPDPLATVARFGISVGLVEDLLRNLSWYAGCVVEKVGERAYAVRFADGYHGAPDASWFVVKKRERFQFHFRGENVPVRDLLLAVIESEGGTMAYSLALADTKVIVDGQTSTLEQALDLICECSAPQLAWRVQDGIYRFELKQKN